MSASKPHALVIRGSLGGLCAGVCLRAAGWHVSIFERSPVVMDDRGAGIVLQSEMLNLLEGLKLAPVRKSPRNLAFGNISTRLAVWPIPGRAASS